MVFHYFGWSCIEGWVYLVGWCVERWDRFVLCFNWCRANCLIMVVLHFHMGESYCLCVYNYPHHTIAWHSPYLQRWHQEVSFGFHTRFGKHSVDSHRIDNCHTYVRPKPSVARISSIIQFEQSLYERYSLAQLKESPLIISCADYCDAL
jgi:hypothetical protein